MFGCFFQCGCLVFFKGVMSDCFFFSEVMSGFFSSGLCLGVSVFQWGCLSSN